MNTDVKMKVLKDPAKEEKESWKKVVVCRKCKAELEIEVHDVYFVSNRYEIKCPCCYRVQTLATRSVPALVRKQAQYTADSDGYK